MTDKELDQHRLAGEMSLVLENGTQEEKESLLRCFLQCGKSRAEVGEIRDSYGIFYKLP